MVVFAFINGESVTIHIYLLSMSAQLYRYCILDNNKSTTYSWDGSAVASGA